MSIEALCGRHTVTVLEPTLTVGDEMGAATTFAAASPARTLTCTVEPESADQITDLQLQQGVVETGVLYFSSRPTNLKGRRVRFENKTFRLVGHPMNEQNQDRLWMQRYEAHSDDNPNISLE